MIKTAILNLIFGVLMMFSGSLFAIDPGTPEVAAPATVGNPVLGKQKAFLCKGCHNKKGYKTAYPKVYEVPKVGGQHAEYIVSALGQYRSGERSFETMRAIASNLTDQDIADIAAYYSSAGK